MTHSSAAPEPVLELKRTFRTGCEKDFDAGDKPEPMAQWFCSLTPNRSGRITALDARPPIEVDDSSSGSRYKLRGGYREVRRPQQRVFPWEFEPDPEFGKRTFTLGFSWAVTSRNDESGPTTETIGSRGIKFEPRRVAMRKAMTAVLASGLVFAGLVSARIGWAQMPTPKTSAAFDKLKSLTGDWTATAEGIPPFTSTIRLISNGTAIEETFNNDMDHQMVTVYSSDGNRVALTHFCSAGNQPRMETPADRENPNEYVFSFTGATNLASPDDLHMHRMVLNIVDADHFTEVWHAKMGGKDTPKEFSFERKK